jgi:methionyl-tRNA formyltransferase
MIVSALASLDDLAPQEQPAQGVTYAAKIDKAEARIDWTRPAAEIDRQIRGLSPHPGAWTGMGGDRVRVLLCELSSRQGVPGTLLDDGLTVACGQGAVRLTRLQRAGKAAMDAGDFLRGIAGDPLLRFE